jgi:hypothetical protein
MRRFVNVHTLAVRGLGRFTLLCAIVPALQAAPSVQECITTISQGPSLCLTPQATYYPLPQKIAETYADTSSNHNRCRAVLDATVALGNLGSQAREAVGVLVRKFPRAVHVEMLTNLSYTAGAGTFEDWVMTKTMAAKTKMELTPPFAAFNLIDPCADFIEASETHEIFEPVYKGGQIQSAIVTLRVCFVVNAGACALNRITGLNLGSDPTAWRQQFGLGTEPIAAAPTVVPPRSPQPQATAPAMTGPVSLSYADLLARSPIGSRLEVRLFGGSILIGQLADIDEQKLSVDLPGAAIVPVRRSAVSTLTILTNR